MRFIFSREDTLSFTVFIHSFAVEAMSEWMTKIIKRKVFKNSENIKETIKNFINKKREISIP
jgi:hypothetical protein